MAEDAARLRALQQHGLLDDRTKAALERIARLAARLLDAPAAAVILGDGEREWVAACHGAVPDELTLEQVAAVGSSHPRPGSALPPDRTPPRAGEPGPPGATPAVVSGGLHFSAGVPLVTPDGERLGALCVGDYWPSPLSDARSGLLEDLAALAAECVELRAARVFLEHIAETSPVATFRRQVHGNRITYVSSNAERLFGYRPDELVGTTFLEYVHPDDREALQGVVAHALVGREQTAGYEYRFRHKDGGWRWVHTVVRIERDPDGQPVALLGYALDITEAASLRRALEHEREAAARLRQLDDLKNELLTAVSHELRTPLTGVVSNALVLERSFEALSASERRELLTRLADSARQLERLLSDLLDVDRLARGVKELRRRPADVGALVAAMVARTEVLGDRSVSVDADEDVIVAVDVPKVERIVESLLVNAARHTPAGTAVRVRVAATDGDALLAVEDEGPGVPDELKEAIFEPFRRGDRVASHAPGTGLGLTLVARFAELHGGRAWVEDRPSGGASFRVLLPGGG